METVDIMIRCPRCLGTGIDDNNRSGDPPVIISVPCESCGATGYTAKDKIDTTDIMEQLGAINGKVTAIWNKVKDL